MEGWGCKVGYLPPHTPTHKVVRQQNSGVVDDFILPYSAVYLRIQKWKNYWNRSTFAKVIVKIKVARFFVAHGVQGGPN